VRLFLPAIEIGLEAGLGVASSSSQGYNPQVMMTYSWDGGKTWSNERMESAGRMGSYKKRVQFRRLGSGSDFVLKIRMTDPIPWRVVDCFYQDLKAGK
jgi:hypothetical protein